jgi:hypothetical protein
MTRTLVTVQIYMTTVRLRSLAEIAVNAYEYGSIPFALYEIGERRLCFVNINLDRIN